ncbi:portal protein [Cerasicoccus frondis]|uniref:portal protein n=1 Tax=Cerasicoccus frondis TaxID=490090 RepID=UPI002852D15B|nr:hypothetical protein [Cerasicoccus frondis]
MHNGTHEGKRQLERAVERADKTVGESKPDPNGPLMPFPTNYRLTQEQESELLEHVFEQIDTLEQDLGRNEVLDENWHHNANIDNKSKLTRTFMGKRRLFEEVYHNRVDWRSTVIGGIFAESNFVVPISRRICRQAWARANNYFFATDPWFEAKPRDIPDQDLAERIESFCKYKLREAGSKHSKEQAVEIAAYRNECVIKTTHASKWDYYQVEDKVLVDEDGKPIIAKDGDYITESDVWVEITPPSEVDDVTPAAITVLQRDQVTLRPKALVYVKKLVTRRLKRYHGPKSKPVFFTDFLCAEDAESIQDAAFCAHLYDVPVMDMVEEFQEAFGGESPEDTQERIAQGVELLRELASNDSKPKSGVNRIGDEGEEVEHTADDANNNPVAEIAECYLRYDANGDGLTEEIMVIVDRHTRRPIYYEYTANVTVDGERPFDTVRWIEVEGKWHGVGMMELFETHQSVIDLQVNRWNFAQGGSGRVDFWNPNAVEEGDRERNLQLNWGGTYTLKPGKKAEDALQSVYLNDIKHEQVQAIFELFLQMAMNESGVQNANDANMAGLEQSKLATGIRNIEKSGMEIFGAFLSALEPGLESALNRELQVALANIDEEEAFMSPAEDDDRLLTLTREEVANINLRVSLLLTRYKGEQQIQQALQATEIVERYYALHPLVQRQVAPLYRQMLKALDMKIDADELIQPIDIPVAPGSGPNLDANQATAATAPKPSTPALNY